MILVYQMAKVASRSWLELARAASPEETALHHCHWIVPANRSRIEQVYAWPTERQTIANMFLPNKIPSTGARVWADLQAARQRHETVRVITGIREPVARSISLIMFMADFFGHRTRPLNPSGPRSPEYVIAALRESWELVLTGTEPDTTFEWLLWYLIRAGRTWFSEEFAETFAVDVRQEPYRSGDGGLWLKTSDAEILIYRVEDMMPESTGYAPLVAGTGRFLGIPVTGFPTVNSSAQRRSRNLVAQIQNEFRLPAAMLDAIYDDPFVRHFYGDDEIASFKDRWRAPHRHDVSRKLEILDNDRPGSG